MSEDLLNTSNSRSNNPTKTKVFIGFHWKMSYSYMQYMQCKSWGPRDWKLNNQCSGLQAKSQLSTPTKTGQQLGISWNTPKKSAGFVSRVCVWLWRQLRICLTAKLSWSWTVTWCIGMLNLRPVGSGAFIETTTTTTKRDSPHITTSWYIRNSRNSYTTDLRFVSINALSKCTFWS